MNNDILAYCVKNGKTTEEVKGYFELTDNGDGNGPSVSSWTVSGLTEPTQTDLDALTQTEKDTVATKISDDISQTKKIALQRDISAGNTLIADGHSKIDVSDLETQLAAL